MQRCQRALRSSFGHRGIAPLSNAVFSGSAGLIITELIKSTGSTRIPASLSVTNRNPLSIGGKGAYADNDQFQGILDDVWVRIG